MEHRHLNIVLVQAERSWAYSMQLKHESAAQHRKTHHARARLHRCESIPGQEYNGRLLCWRCREKTEKRTGVKGSDDKPWGGVHSRIRNGYETKAYNKGQNSIPVHALPEYIHDGAPFQTCITPHRAAQHANELESLAACDDKVDGKTALEAQVCG